jgi:hypothetical protein
MKRQKTKEPQDLLRDTSHFLPSQQLAAPCPYSVETGMWFTINRMPVCPVKKLQIHCKENGETPAASREKLKMNSGIRQKVAGATGRETAAE